MDVTFKDCTPQESQELRTLSNAQNARKERRNRREMSDGFNVVDIRIDPDPVMEFWAHFATLDLQERLRAAEERVNELQGYMMGLVLHMRMRGYAACFEKKWVAEVAHLYKFVITTHQENICLDTVPIPAVPASLPSAKAILENLVGTPRTLHPVTDPDAFEWVASCPVCRQVSTFRCASAAGLAASGPELCVCNKCNAKFARYHIEEGGRFRLKQTRIKSN